MQIRTLTGIVNVTISFPYKTSWTNDTVELRKIDKPISRWVAYQALWVDEDIHRIYTWGGYSDQAQKEENQGFWWIDTDGNGGASWKPSSSTDNGLDDLYRPSNSADTVCNRVGYSLNGWVTQAPAK